jgi:dihydrofolate reductase
MYLYLMENCKFIIIAAVSVDGIIGINNEIPWNIPEDFRHFRNTTMGNMLLVGYNTFKTLPPKAFEGREYIVLNSTEHIEDVSPSVFQFRELSTILDLLRDDKTNVEKVFVAGGAMVYDSLIDYCDEAIITWVNKKYPKGNKRFPITKLFTNFGVHSDQDWQKSKTGVEYKVTVYKKK